MSKWPLWNPQDWNPFPGLKTLSPVTRTPLSHHLRDKKKWVTNSKLCHIPSHNSFVFDTNIFLIDETRTEGTYQDRIGQIRGLQITQFPVLNCKWCKRLHPRHFTDIVHHIHTAMPEETMQGTNLYIRSNLGFSVLLKDTSTLTLGEPGFELATLRLPSGHSTPEPLPPP